MELKIGDKAPVFKISNQNGELIDTGEFIGIIPLVIYFCLLYTSPSPRD